MQTFRTFSWTMIGIFMQMNTLGGSTEKTRSNRAKPMMHHYQGSAKGHKLCYSLHVGTDSAVLLYLP